MNKSFLTTITTFLFALLIVPVYLIDMLNYEINLPEIRDILITLPLLILISFLQFKCWDKMTFYYLEALGIGKRSIWIYLQLTEKQIKSEETHKRFILLILYMFLLAIESFVLLMLSPYIKSKDLFQFAPFAINPILIFFISIIYSLKHYKNKK